MLLSSHRFVYVVNCLTGEVIASEDGSITAVDVSRQFIDQRVIVVCAGMLPFPQSVYLGYPIDNIARNW